MEKNPILFDDWLEEYLENETDEYRDQYEKEKFKLELAYKSKKCVLSTNYLKENLQKK